MPYPSWVMEYKLDNCFSNTFARSRYHDKNTPTTFRQRDANVSLPNTKLVKSSSQTSSTHLCSSNPMVTAPRSTVGHFLGKYVSGHSNVNRLDGDWLDGEQPILFTSLLRKHERQCTYTTEGYCSNDCALGRPRCSKTLVRGAERVSAVG